MHVITSQVWDVIFKGAQSVGFLLSFQVLLLPTSVLIFLRYCAAPQRGCAYTCAIGLLSVTLKESAITFMQYVGKMLSLRNKSCWLLQEASASFLSHVWLSGNSVVLPRGRIGRGTRQKRGITALPWT